MSYKGIIFDFNGTLVWDNELHKEAWIRYSAELGKSLDGNGFYNTVHGKTNNDILEMLLERKLSSEQIAVMAEEKEAQYRIACLQNPGLFKLAPGVEDFLDYITAAGIPRTIATASEKPNLDFYFEHLELERWFEPELIVYNDGTVANKPEPDIYIKAAGNIGFSPEDVVIVEDSYYGVVSAKGAGAGCLIVTGPAEDQHNQLTEVEGINSFISDFAEIDRSLFSL